MKKLRYLAEAALLYLCFALFKLIGLEKSSALGGWLGRMIGPRLAASRKALKNIELAFPEKSTQEHREILTQMWDNLGRVIAEYPHLKTMTDKNITYEGLEHITPPGTPIILIAGHIANWEVISAGINMEMDEKINSLYRAPNNPYVRHLLERIRTQGSDVSNIPKSKSGVRDMVRVLQDGGKLGILIDQKYNQGIAVPFFGRPAMTSPAAVQLAQKFSCPLVPVSIRRMGGPHFKITVFPPLNIDNKSEYEALLAMHQFLEDRIKEHPGHWLWLHRRWDSAALKGQENEHV